MSFTKFKTIVKSIHGVWESEIVRFAKTQCEMVAHYRPNYPAPSPEDSEIRLLVPGGLWSARGPHGVSF